MIVGLIPARLKSNRLPFKALLKISEIPLVIHTLSRAKLSKRLDKVYVCTDLEKIAEVVKKYNGDFIMTKKYHKNGTERIAEAAKKMKNLKRIIDIQCDEVLLDPESIDQLINFHDKNDHFDIVVPHSTLKKKTDQNLVKIVSNDYNYVLYMSRNNIPFSKKKIKYKKHLDIISFKPSALQKFFKLKRSSNEKVEGIELLRAIDNKLKVGTFNIKTEAFSVNTRDDFCRASKILKKFPCQKYYFNY